MDFKRNKIACPPHYVRQQCELAKRCGRGFSIIELIVCASIIAIMSLLVIANFKGSAQKSALNNETERLATIIREAHIDALIGLTVNGVRPIGGFGVYLNECTANCSYSLFANQADQDGDYDYEYDHDVNDSLVQQIGMLDSHVYIDNIIPDNALNIIFIPPYGTIYFNGSDSIDQATVTLGYQQTQYKKNIIISRLTGKIDVQ